MTVIEFFDKAPIENIISCLTMNPDKVIFVGNGKSMRRQGAALKKFIDKKGLHAEFSYVQINKHNLWGIVDTLSDIVDREDECVFDLNGGEDLVLVAIGIVYQKYKEIKKIQMHRYNIRSGVVSDCDGDGNVLPMEHYAISVDDNIALHGGAIRYSGDVAGKEGTIDWDITDEFIEDVAAMWSLCKQDPALWNARIGVLTEFEKYGQRDVDSLSVSVDRMLAENRMRNIDSKNIYIEQILKLLAGAGLILDTKDDGMEISYRYKSEQVKKCLSKAGTTLELMVLILAKGARNNAGVSVYNDAVNGVCIDWDGELCGEDAGIDVENEIDVFLMKGLVPILISCKNGLVDVDELYKLNTVANRFGGPYAKRVLIATYLSKNENGREALRLRAKEMDIDLIENVHNLTNEEFAEKLKKINT